MSASLSADAKPTFYVGPMFIRCSLTMSALYYIKQMHVLRVVPVDDEQPGGDEGDAHVPHRHHLQREPRAQIEGVMEQ